MSLFVFFISLLIVAQHVSGNHVLIIRNWRLRDVIASCWYVSWLQEGGQDRLAGSASMDALPTNRSWQPSRSHGTYQHKAITSRSRQLLMMGTWLPETCWATIRREIKNRKSDIKLVFLIHTELRCTVNHTSKLGSVHKTQHCSSVAWPLLPWNLENDLFSLFSYIRRCNTKVPSPAFKVGHTFARF